MYRASSLMLCGSRSALPIQLRASEYSQRLDIEWHRTVSGLPLLGPWYLRRNMSPSTALDVSNAVAFEDGAEFRMAPLRPRALRFIPYPQRGVFWGFISSLFNVPSSLFGAGVSLVCHTTAGKPVKAVLRCSGYLLLTTVGTPVLFFLSVWNAFFGFVTSSLAPGRYCFDDHKGYYAHRSTYSQPDLQARIRQLIMYGELSFRLLSSTRDSTRSTFQSQNGQIGEAHYQTLGLSRNASQREIDDRFKQLKSAFPPERDAHKHQEICVAYQTIGNATTRKLYDVGGDGAVQTTGRNALFTGFCNPRTPVYRNSVRESIGGPLFHAWFTGDLYFTHYQTTALDRAVLSRMDMMLLHFYRIAAVSATLEKEIIVHFDGKDEDTFFLRCQNFVRKYLVTAPLGPEMSYMLGRMYVATAKGILRPYSFDRFLHRQLMFNHYVGLLKLGRLQWAAHRRGDTKEMNLHSLTAQIDMLDTDLVLIGRGTVHYVVSLQPSKTERMRRARAFLILGRTMQAQGKPWIPEEVDQAELFTTMNSAAKRWKSVKLSTIKF